MPRRPTLNLAQSQGPGVGSTRVGPQFMARAYRVADPAIATAEPGTPIPFVLSSPGTKRDGLNLAGLPFYLDNYRKNPVVLPFHSYFDFSIGRGLIEAIGPERSQSLYAESMFDIEDPLGELSDRKYRQGFMFAVSLGWDDIDDNGVPVRVSKKKPVARDVLEFSVVSVPGDADALIDAGDRGLEAADRRATRGFLIAAAKVLTASDPRADAVDETLQRLAACTGDECAVPLADARQLFGRADDADADDDAPPAEGAARALDSEEAGPPAGDAPADEASAEARRRAVMAAMVAAVWVDNADDADDKARKRALDALRPEYRRLGLTPPAYLDAVIVAKLEPHLRAQLFVNGELEEMDMTVTPAGQRVGKKFSGATRTKMESILADLRAATKKQQALLDEADDSSGERGHRCTCGGHTAESATEPAAGANDRALLDDVLSELSALYPDVDIVLEERQTAAPAPAAATAARTAAKPAARQISDVSVVQVVETPEDSAYLSGSVVFPEKIHAYLSAKAIAKLQAGADGSETSVWFSSYTDDPEWPIVPRATLGVDVLDSVPENVMSLIKAIAAGGDPAIMDIDGVLASDPDWAGTEEPAEDETDAEVPAEEPADDTSGELSIDDYLANWAPLPDDALAAAVVTADPA